MARTRFVLSIDIAVLDPILIKRRLVAATRGRKDLVVNSLFLFLVSRVLYCLVPRDRRKASHLLKCK